MTKNLIEFIESKKQGDILNENDINYLTDIKNALNRIKIENKDKNAKIEFPARYLKEVYNYLISLK